MTSEPPEVPDAAGSPESAEPPAEPDLDLPDPGRAPDFQATPADAGAEETEGPDESPFSSGEGMVALGGAIVAAVFLIFEFIGDVYDVNTATLIIAVAVVVLPRLDPRLVDQIAPLAVLMKLTGYLLVIAGAIEVLMEIRFGILDDVIPVLGALAAYAGYAIAFLGARSIET